MLITFIQHILHGELEPLLLAIIESMAADVYKGVAGYCYKTQ